MRKVSPKEIRRRILLRLYEACQGRREHTVNRKELVEELGIPEWVVEASLLYMDTKGWIGSLVPSALRISVKGIEVVEDRKLFEEEFGRGSNVVLVVHEGIVGKGGFERVLEAVESSALSDVDKEEVKKLVDEVEERLEEIGPGVEGLQKCVMRVLEKAEWLRPVLGSVVCGMILEKLGMQ